MELPPPLIQIQLTGILDAVLLGFVLAGGYDCYRGFRAGGMFRSPVAIFCVDFFFWVAASVFSLWYLFTYRWGEVVLPTYISLAAGAAGYFICFSRFLLPLWCRLFAFLFGTLKGIARITALAGRGASRPLAGLRRRTGAAVKDASLQICPYLSRIFSSRRRS